jgi:YVTN family beta-propeller protein
MKNITNKALIAALMTIIFVSCKSEDHSLHPALNINYPAAYVANGKSNTVSVIRLSDNTITETIGLNGATYPHHIYLNPAKTKLAVAITSTDLSAGHIDHAGGTSGFKAQIIDAVSGAIDKEIILPKMPHNAIFNASGTELWVGQSDEMQSKILIYKTSDWILQNTINVGKGLSEITFSTDGTKAFACNTTDGTVTLIDVTSKIVHTTITVGTAPVGAWAASNGYMYVDNEKSKTISEISVSGMSITETITLNYTPAYVAYHTASQELWISDATNGKIHYYKRIATTAKWAELGEFATGADTHAIVFTPDGTKAYITNQGNATVSVVEVSTHSVIKNIPVGTKPNGIALKQ